MRLFVAIHFSDEFKKTLIEVMHELKRQGVQGNFTSVEHLHMTLCFIGETKEVQKVKEALKRVTFKPFELALSEIGNFRDLIWVGTKNNQKMSALVKDIRTSLEQEGIAFDAKPFKPHITLIRKSNGKKVQIKLPDVKLKVDKISLMNSAQINGKLIYKEISSIS